ncbi:GNAT family N-acetyltransferase [Taibaiella koreensis]|uniref:GNAT family N-acetyltransferase n=1 Tax=Taibaiella koreensis TaxID=1268548 RepID=UPI001F09034B|nr:GNAT family N-acetyltransferase [Taibaiella koreensis]
MMVTTTVKVRPAQRSDAAEMMSLIRELALYEKAPEQVTVTEEHFIESGFGAQPVWWAEVAVVPASEDREEQIIGFALYYVRYSTWKGQRMYLEDIVVREAWRGKGIGGLLMDKLIATARDRRFSGMLWQVLDWNEPAIAFYRKYGAQFDNSWINVSLEL